MVLLTSKNNKAVFLPFEDFVPTFNALPASLILVEQTVCKICKSPQPPEGGNNENEVIDKPAYNFYQVLGVGVCTLPDAFVRAGKEDNETPTHDKQKQALVYFDETNQRLVYVDFELLQQNFRLIDYAFHQDLNEAFQDRALPFIDFLETIAFRKDVLPLRNSAWQNSKNLWEFMNGKMQHKEYLEFSENI